MEDMKLVLRLTNSEDALIRITSTFHRRGFKIKSLDYREEKDGASLIITACGLQERQEQMLSQLIKLHDIREAQRA